jgi:superfamily II DNA/RNA helicase
LERYGASLPYTALGSQCHTYLIQGADQAGILLVIDYQIEKTSRIEISQHLGRAARGVGETGFYVGLAEKSFDDTVRRAADEKAKGKAKKTISWPGDDAYLESESNRTDAQLSGVYNDSAIRLLRSTGNDAIPDAFTGDFVNAPSRGIKCRRRVLNLAYDNVKRQAGKSSLTST